MALQYKLLNVVLHPIAPTLVVFLRVRVLFAQPLRLFKRTLQSIGSAVVLKPRAPFRPDRHWHVSFVEDFRTCVGQVVRI